MRPHARAILFLLAVFASGCESCQPGAGATDASLSDTTIADVQQGTDAGLTEVGDTGGADVDVLDAPGDASDIAGNCGADLPEPGQPCTNVGETRCTNVGSIPDDDQFMKCYRPNSVVCEKAANGGAPAWQLTPCPVGTNPCTYSGNYCVTGKSGDKCVPLRLENNHKGIPPGSYLGGLRFELCAGYEGVQGCTLRWPAKCTTFDQLTPEVKEAVLAVLPPCTSYLSDVAYFFPSGLCPSSNTVVCKTVAGTADKPPQTVEVSLTKCVIDKGTGKPRCAQTCAEMGVKETW